MALEQGKVYTGKEFRKLTKGKRLVKLTNVKENHNGYQYKDGLNILREGEEFNPTGECSKGGFYFIEYKNTLGWLNYGVQREMVYIRKVKILPDSKVYVERGKFKTNKFILGPRKMIHTSGVYDDDEVLVECIKHLYVSRVVEHRTAPIPDYILAAIAEDSYETYINIRNEQPYLIEQAMRTENKRFIEIFHSGEWAVIKNPYNIKYVTQTPELCALAVSMLYDVLEYIENITEDLCILALSQSAEAFVYISRVGFATKELAKYSVERYVDALRHIDAGLIDKSLCMRAVHLRWEAIRYIPLTMRTYEVCFAAASKNIDALKYVPRPMRRRIIDELAAKYGV